MQPNPNSLFFYRPTIPQWVFKIIWVIPILMTVAAGIIFFAEKNTMHALAVFGAGVGMGLALAGMVYGVQKLIENKGGFEITKDGTLTIQVANDTQIFSLKELESITPIELLGATQFKLKKGGGEEKLMMIAGALSGPQKEELSAVLMKFNVALTHSGWFGEA